VSRSEQEVFSQAREIVRKATEGFVFDDMSVESRKKLCEAIASQWKALAELVPPKEPEVTVAMNDDGSVKVWACIPVPYYVVVEMRPDTPKVPEPIEPFYLVVAGEGPDMQFVEIETAGGRSIRAGEWKKDGDFWKIGPFYSHPPTTESKGE
jgi:hypothetical protein